MQPADALDAVAEAREAVNHAVNGALSHGVGPLRLTAFESAVRAAERARLRGLVEGERKVIPLSGIGTVGDAYCRAFNAALNTILTKHLGAPQ